MLRRALAWLLWLACLPLQAQSLADIPPLTSPVVDTTGTLSPAQKQPLEQQALALQQRKGSQLQVLVVSSTRPETIEQYAVRVFEQWKLGREGIDDGVLLIVAKDDRAARIETGYGLEGAIPDAVANRVIQEYLVPKFREGDYAGGIADATGMLVQLIDGEPLPAPVSRHRADANAGARGGDWMFALFAAFIVATIVRGMFGRAPSGVRGLFTGAGAGGAAFLLSSLVPVAAIAGVLGLLYGLAAVSARGRYARHGHWGGWGGGAGGWGGGGFGGGGFGGGGGWSGGGGGSGGGGASGSW